MRAEQEKINTTSSKLLAKNMLFNIGFKVVPLLIGLLVIPILINRLGETYFGYLMSILLLISYFAMFDLGVGRALIRELSDSIAVNDLKRLAKIAWTGLIFISIMGLFAGIFLFLFADLIMKYYLKTDDQVLVNALVYTSISIPLIISTIGFKSILIAQQRVLGINIIQSLGTLMNYVIPVLALIYLNSEFDEIIFYLLISKIIIVVVYTVYVLSIHPEMKKKISFDLASLRSMISFGKWVTVSNVIGPLMGQLDRYFILVFLSASALTFYTTPLEVLSRVTILPMAIISVMFPAFSTLNKVNAQRSEKMFLQSSIITFVCLFPILIALSSFSDYGLTLWIGNDFGVKSSPIAQIFCIVFLFRGVSYIFSTYLHACNRPDLTAKFHLFELILYSITLYFVISYDDILFIAIVSLMVTILDFTLLLYSSYKVLSHEKENFRKLIFWIVVFGTTISIPLFNLKLSIEITLIFLVFILFVFITWNKLLDRKIIYNLLKISK